MLLRPQVARLQAIAATLSTDIEKLRASYAEKRALFDRLEQQVAVYDERLAFAELDTPHGRMMATMLAGIASSSATFSASA